jgi:Excalibur calcium-binding domain
MARPSDDTWPSRSRPAAPRPPAPAGTIGLNAADDDMPLIIRDRSAVRDRIGTSSRERLRAARLASGWSPRTDAVPGGPATPAAWTANVAPGPPQAAVTPSVPVTPVSGIDQVIRGPLFRPPEGEPAQPPEQLPAHEVVPAEDDWFWQGEAARVPEGVADPFAFLQPARTDSVEFSQGTDPFGLPLPEAIAPRSAAARHARRGGSTGRRAWRMPAVTGAAGVLAGIVLGVTGSQHAAPAPAEAAVVPSTVTVTAPTVPPVTVTVTTAAARPSPIRYADCSAVTRAGAAPLYRGEPGYRAALDPDGDGIACEHG